MEKVMEKIAPRSSPLPPVREVCSVALFMGCIIALEALIAPSALQLGASACLTPAEAAELRALALAAIAATAASAGLHLRFSVLAPAALGPRLSRRDTVTAYAFFVTVFGVDVLFCFAGAAWGDE